MSYPRSGRHFEIRLAKGLATAGVGLVTVSLTCIYWPLALLFLGVVCLYSAWDLANA